MTYEHTQGAGLEELTKRHNPEFPDVPKMITEAQKKYKRMHRDGMLVDIAEFIKEATPCERRHIINMLIERGSEVDGSATELEKAFCEVPDEYVPHEPICGCDGCGSSRSDEHYDRRRDGEMMRRD